jgi:hypothetical protein
LTIATHGPNTNNRLIVNSLAQQPLAMLPSCVTMAPFIITGWYPVINPPAPGFSTTGLPLMAAAMQFPQLMTSQNNADGAVVMPYRPDLRGFANFPSMSTMASPESHCGAINYSGQTLASPPAVVPLYLSPVVRPTMMTGTQVVQQVVQPVRGSYGGDMMRFMSLLAASQNPSLGLSAVSQSSCQTAQFQQTNVTLHVQQVNGSRQ